MSIKYEAAFQQSVSWYRIEFWQIKNILEKMTTVASSDSCPGYGRPQTAHTAAKITKVKDPRTDFSISAFNPVRSSVKNISSKHFCP